MKKKLLCLLLCLSLLMGIVPAYGAGERLACQRGGMSLYVNQANGCFRLVDRMGGEWYSSPADAAEQEGVKGAVKNRLLSLFTGTVYDMDTGKETVFSSHSLKLGYEALENGYALTATPTEGISFRLEVTLEEDYLAVRLPMESLSETAPLVLRDLQLLPTFGAGGAEDSGFLLVPDGSGAIIAFNNGRKGSYDEPVYGTDKAVIRDALAVEKQDVYLPLYGIERNGHGILALLTEGESAANIRAASAGNGTPYNTAYASYTLRRKDTQSIAADVSQTLYEEPRTLNSDLELRLYPCQNGYMGMADALAGYLQSELGMRPVAAQGRSAVLSLYGGVSERAKLFGIPLWNRAGALTPFKEAERITSEVREAGADGLSVRLLDWEQNQLLGKAAGGVKVPTSLGGKGGLTDFTAWCAERQIPVYAGISALRFSKAGGGVSAGKSAVRDIGQSPAAQFDYYRASYASNKASASYLLRPGLIGQRQERTAAALAALGFSGTAYTDLGSVLYSDFTNRGGASMQETAKAQAAVLDQAAGRAAVEGGYLYAAARSELVVAAPIGSSGMKCTDRSVPFYQIALSGLTYYTTPAVNAGANQRSTLLFALETGSLLHWAVIGSGGAALEGSDLIGASYAANRDAILEATAELAPILARISGQRITDHRQLPDGRVCTTYENGIQIVIDYAQGVYDVR